MLNSPSNFRLWVLRTWYENCEERREWATTPMTLGEYLNYNGLWLRRTWRSLDSN